MAKIDVFFQYMKEIGASDLHLSAGLPPKVRLHGDLENIELQGIDTLSNEMLEVLLAEIAGDERWAKYEETRDIDFAYELEGVARFRCNYFYQNRGYAAVFRLIPSTILSVEELGLPHEVLRFARLNRGLVLVTGATGSGKSTTLAALVDYVNRHRKDHIITVEDPIEFVHPSKGCTVNHREVGAHTQSFAAALRAALREDPDVILVGELRDLETIELAITAAETGHLVFATLHTSSAAKTVDRIIDAFPAGQQAQVRTMLSESLKGVIAQQLCRKVDGKGRVAALEVLFVNTAISNLIREGKTFQIPGTMQTGRSEGMQTMDMALRELLDRRLISGEEAFLKAHDKKAFAQFEPQ